MPNRIIRPGVTDSARLCACSHFDRWLWLCLVVTVDDFGRYDGRPEVVRAACFPLELDSVSTADVAGALVRLAVRGLVIRYAVAGRPFIQLTGWRNRIRQHKSRYPCRHGFTVRCGDCELAAGGGQNPEPDTPADLLPGIVDSTDETAVEGQVRAGANIGGQVRADARQTVTGTVTGTVTEGGIRPPAVICAQPRANARNSDRGDGIPHGYPPELAEELRAFFGPGPISGSRAAQAAAAAADYGLDRTVDALRACRRAGEPFGVAMAAARRAAWNAGDAAAGKADAADLGELTRAAMG